MAAKRKLDMVISDLEEEANATVHGAILELSPLKVRKNNKDVEYFVAKLTDSKKVARLVCFEPNLRKDMENLKKNNESVSCVNCNVRRSRMDDNQ